MKKPAILFVDASVEMRDLLSAALARHYAVEVTGSLTHARAECRHPKHAAFVVDIAGSPAGDDGVNFIRELRAAGDERPVVAISGRHEAELAARCYEAGADGFVPKTLWTIRELRALLSRLLRRAKVAALVSGRIDGILLPKRKFSFGGAIIDSREMTAAFPRGRVQHLNPKEIGILHVLATRSGHLARRSEILARVWGPGAVQTSKTLDTYLVRLRRAYQAGGLDLTRVLHAKPKVGWWVDAEAKR
jgi:DNA-binding response OmpR family regulator